MQNDLINLNFLSFPIVDDVRICWRSWKVFSYKNQRRRCFIIKVVLKISQNSPKKKQYQSFFFNKVAGPTFLKKKIWHRCFPVNFPKFLRTPFLQKTSGQFLLPCKYLKKLVWYKTKLLLRGQLSIAHSSVFKCSAN